jgi:hypothetical protein
VLFIMALLVGFLLHYLLPHLRKLCCCLDIVLWVMALVVGFLLHYLLPHPRKLLLLF